MTLCILGTPLVTLVRLWLVFQLHPPPLFLVAGPYNYVSFPYILLWSIPNLDWTNKRDYG